MPTFRTIAIRQSFALGHVRTVTREQHVLSMCPADSCDGDGGPVSPAAASSDVSRPSAVRTVGKGARRALILPRAIAGSFNSGWLTRMGRTGPEMNIGLVVVLWGMASSEVAAKTWISYRVLAIGPDVSAKG